MEYGKNGFEISLNVTVDVALQGGKSNRKSFGGIECKVPGTEQGLELTGRARHVPVQEPKRALSSSSHNFSDLLGEAELVIRREPLQILYEF